MVIHTKDKLDFEIQNCIKLFFSQKLFHPIVFIVVRQTCLSFFKYSIAAKFSGMYGVEELCDKETQVQQHNNHTI